MRSGAHRAMVVACVVLACAGAARAGENLLRNAGFERNGGAASVPADWQREVNPFMNAVMRGPFQLVHDAHGGRWAVQMETEEWNFLRPQRVMQAVKLPAGATMLHLSAWCKGRGLLGFVFEFRAGGKPLQVEKLDLGFGPITQAKEVGEWFAIEPQWERYEAAVDIPKGADAVLVKIGNTVGVFGRENVFGRAILDDVSLTATTGAAAKSKPSHAATEKLDVGAGLVNAAPFSRVWMEPASLNPKALVDGDTGTMPTPYAGCERGVITVVTLPKALPVKAVALHLAGNVDTYVVRGDAAGDGKFETLLARATGMQGTKGWVTHAAAGAPLRAIRIQGIRGALWGFRGSRQFMNELDVFVPASSISQKALKDAAVFVFDQSPPAGISAVSVKPAIMDFKTGPHKFRKMVCADLWMWGIVKNGEGVKKADLLKNKTFLDTAKTCKYMGVNWVFIDLTNSSCWNKMPWPSKVCNGTKPGDNPLKELIAALHEAGFKVVVETLHNFTPFEPIKWHFPCEETMRYPDMKQYPNILFGNYVRDNWLTIYREMMDAGADGVCLGSDEFYYRSIFLRSLPADDAARKAYRARYGEEIPKTEADSLAFRRWVVLRHEGLGRLFGYWSDTLKAQYPGIYTCSVFMQPVGKSNLYEQGVPFDVMGALGHLDEIGSDYMEPYDLRMTAAANGWRRTTQLFSGNMYSKFSEPAINLYGPAMWMLMYGGGSCNYWRYYQIKCYNVEAVKHGYEMVDELMSLGMWDARPPKAIAVLTSRASVDWWQVKAFYGRLARADMDRGLEARRGWFAEEAVISSVLMKNGCPFDWFYLDWPERMGDLSAYKVLVLPFAYSISDAALAKVKAAAAKGARVVLFGPAGKTDEWGEPRKAAAFDELVRSGQAIVVDEDIMRRGGEDRFVAKVRRIVDDALGAQNPVRAQVYGRRVDTTLLVSADGVRFLFVLNWEKTPSTVDFDVTVPAGNYRVFMRDDTMWYGVTLGGKDVFTRDMLKRLRVVAPAQKGQVYCIRRM